jgi:acetylornithine deacetylase/succinyl-diaminopimelate desuccinylase-like protein
MVYGHYDTQPADPLDRWTTPAFEPAIRDGRLYGRGASDDKGNLLAPILATEALLAVSGRLPIGLTFMFEGEEEIRSPNLRAFLYERRKELAVDAVFSADSVMWSHEEPSLVLGCKGLLSFDIHVRSAAVDLHSGLFGGLVPNAVLALSQLLATMVAPTGEILVEGLADGVRAVSAAQMEQAAKVPFDLEGTLAAHGVSEAWGEPAFDPLVRNWYRPTIDLNGISGGFQDEGTKTVIPAEATAKLSCRLAAGQNPDRVANAIKRHLERHVPAQVDARIVFHSGAVAAFSIDAAHPFLAAAREALTRSYGRRPLEVHLGGTLPFATLVGDVLGLSTVMLGWCMPDENLHAPDEFFRLENLDRGARVYADLFSRLGSNAA